MYFESATKGNSSLFAYVMSIMLVALAYAILGQAPLMGVLLYKINSNPALGMDDLVAFEKTMDFTIFGISSNIGLLLLICIFIISMFALWLATKYIHRYSFLNLITPYSRLNWNKILFGFGFWFLLGILLEFILYIQNQDLYQFRFIIPSFWYLLIIAILFIPIQTSFEEIFFRGYIMPGIGLLTKHKWIALVISSMLFGLLHSFNPEIDKFGFWNMQLYYFLAGLFLGLITIWDNSLELALGVHAATNVIGATIFSYEGSVLQTDTLFKSSNMSVPTTIVMFCIAAVIFVVVANNKYEWFQNNLLLKPILRNKPTDSNL